MEELSIKESLARQKASEVKGVVKSLKINEQVLLGTLEKTRTSLHEAEDNNDQLRVALEAKAREALALHGDAANCEDALQAKLAAVEAQLHEQESATANVQLRLTEASQVADDTLGAERAARIELVSRQLARRSVHRDEMLAFDAWAATHMARAHAFALLRRAACRMKNTETASAFHTWREEGERHAALARRAVRDAEREASKDAEHAALEKRRSADAAAAEAQHAEASQVLKRLEARETELRTLKQQYEALEAAVDDANGRTKALRAREKELQAQAELAEQKLRDSTQTHQAEVSALKQEIEAKVVAMVRLRSFIFASAPPRD